MSLARWVARWLILAVLVVGTAAMHTQMPGACRCGGFAPMAGAGMAQTATDTAVMAPSGRVTASLKPSTRVSPIAQTHRSGTPQPVGRAMSEVCRATIPPPYSVLIVALAVLLLTVLTLAYQPGQARRRVWVGRWWWPPAVPRASLGIWRI